MVAPVPGLLRSFVRVIASLWFAAVVLVLLLVALACATVFESMHGTERAAAVFYQSTWFAALLVLLGVNVFAAMIVRFPFSRRQTGFVITHVSILLILIGAWVTREFAVEGQVAILEDETLSQFRTAEEVVTLTNRSSKASGSLPLDRSVFGPAERVENPPHTTLTLDAMTADVELYLPDAVEAEDVVNDGPQPRTAVQIALTTPGGTSSTWLFEGEDTRVGEAQLRVRSLKTPAELSQLLDDSPDTPSQSVGTLRATLGDTTVEQPVEAFQQNAVPVGDTGFTVRVVGYFPHATVGANSELTNAPERPLNPAVQVEVVGPTGPQKRFAFARFPDFGSTHGGPDKPNVALTFVHAGAGTSVAARTVELLSGPGDSLHVRFLDPAATPVNTPLALGASVPTPWSNGTIAVLNRFDRARRVRTFQAPESPRETRIPVLRLRARTADNAIPVWVPKGQSASIAAGGVPYDIAFTDQVAPLGFGITLNKFTVGYYPGTARPRSFESRITIDDAAGGSTHSRTISMNHPTSYGGYTFYQSSYQTSGGRNLSVLSVARDPGQPIVFAGYIALLAGMITVLVVRLRDQQRRPGGASTNGSARRDDGRTIRLLVPGEQCRVIPMTESATPRTNGERNPVPRRVVTTTSQEVSS